jgi:hypothetical protein
MRIMNLLTKPEPKAPVVDLDAYRKRRDVLRRDLLSRREINQAGIERARATLRAVRADRARADDASGGAGQR